MEWKYRGKHLKKDDAWVSSWKQEDGEMDVYSPCIFTVYLRHVSPLCIFTRYLHHVSSSCISTMSLHHVSSPCILTMYLYNVSSIDVYVLAHSNDLEYWPNDLDLPHWNHWPNYLKIGSLAQLLQNMTCVLAQLNDLDQWLNDLKHKPNDLDLPHWNHWPNDLIIGLLAQWLQNMTCVLAQPNDLDHWLNDLHLT